MVPAEKPRRSPVPPSVPEALRAAGLPADDLVDDALLRALRYDAVDLGSRTARLLDIEGCRLLGVNLAESRLDKVTVIDSVFDQCDLANLQLSHSALTRVEAVECRATGLVLSGGLLRNVMFRECLAQMSVFRFATLTNVTFVDCRLDRADFVSADLTATTFRRCDLSDAELSQVKARGALFVDCTWDRVHGISSLSGATVVHGSPLDADAFMVGMATNLGIRLGDPADYPDVE